MKTILCDMQEIQHDLKHSIYRSSTNKTLWDYITSKDMMVTVTLTAQVQSIFFLIFFMKNQFNLWFFRVLRVNSY